MKAASVALMCVLLAGCSSSDAPPSLLNCADPVHGCVMQVDGKPLTLRFSATPAPMRPFVLEVSTAAEKVEASFQMQEMEMGLNRYRLVGDSGTWHASVILPACIRGRSDWTLQLDITTAGVTRHYLLPFKIG